MSIIAVDQITDSNGGNSTTVNGTTPTIYNTIGRNRVINGAMEINQRLFSVVDVIGNGYTVDRFNTYYNYGSVNCTVTQESDAPSGFYKSLKIAYSSGTYTAGNNGYIMNRHMIELNNLLDTAYGTNDAKDLTFSFWLKAKRTGTFTLNVLRSNTSSQRQISRQGQITSADTWQKFIFTIPGDTDGQWANIASPNNVGIFFDIVANVDVTWTTGTLNTSWNNNVTGNRAPGQTNFIQSSGDYFSVTGIQVEVGSVATEFERRPYGTELALCQRYYEKSYNTGTVPGTGLTGGWASFASPTTSTECAPCLNFMVNKRVVPTMTVYNAVTGASGAAYRANDAASIGLTLSYIGDTGVGNAYLASGSVTVYYFHWVAVAEL